jgi:hypothetical protein
MPLPLTFAPGLGEPFGNTWVSQVIVNGSIPSIAVFTAPARGLYLVTVNVHLISTDGTGSLSFSVTAPSSGTFNASLVLSPASDMPGRPAAVFLLAGQQITFFTTASGLTATSYTAAVNVAEVL